MGKLEEFYIILEGGRRVYYPNEQLHGQVIVNLNSPMKMRNIRLKLCGKGYCHWSESRGSGSNTSTRNYTGRETLIDLTNILFGNPPGQGGKNPEHAAGIYVYPFVFQLPPVLPSSVEEEIGYIRYFLKATIDKPWKFDHNTKHPVIINEIIDTNDPKYLMQPGGEQHTKKDGCCCCPSGPLSIRGHIDRKAYCPGEQISITAEAENGTNKDMTAIKAKLKKVTEYHASSNTKTKTKYRHDTIATITGAGIPRGEFANWTNKLLNIPPTPPSILNSNVVKVSYHVELTVDVPWRFDIDLQIPIIIGTVPFRQTYMNAAAPPPPVMTETSFQIAPGKTNIIGHIYNC